VVQTFYRKTASQLQGLFFPFVACLFFSWWGATPSSAVEDEFLAFPWQMDADRITHLRDQDTMTGEGNVILRRLDGADFMPFVIKAERLEYGMQSGEVRASGGMEVRMGNDVINAHEATLNLDQQIGRLSNTSIFLADHNLYFSGSIVEKFGEFSYRFEDGYITSCKVEQGKTTPWGIKARKTDLTMDEYAFLRDATFRIHDIPILYSPYLIVPAKVSRQSGFLFPEISNSNRDGLGLITPIFIDLSPSIDFTFMPGYLQERGAVLGTEFRYAAGPYSMGSFTLQYFDDRTMDVVGDDYKSDGYLRTVNDRYWLRGKVDHQFSNQIQAKLDVDLVSDPDFLMEYRNGILGFDESHDTYRGHFHRGLQQKTIPLRESTLQVSKAWSAAFLGGELRGVDDTGYDEGVEPTHTLPRLVLNGRTPLYGSLGWKWDSEYDYFWRQNGLASHRFDVQTSLATSLPLGPFFEGRVESGVRETIYQVEENGEMAEITSNQNRTLWGGEISIASLVFRDYSWEKDGYHRLRHLIRPSLGYEFVSQDEQSTLPAFDLLDRIERKSMVQMALHQYFSMNTIRSDGSTRRTDFGFFKISGQYDLHEARRDKVGGADPRRPFSDVHFDLDLRPHENFRLRYQTDLNVYGEGVPEYELRTSYSGKNGTVALVDYRYERGVAHQLDLSLGARFWDDYYLKVSTKRSLITDRTIEEKVRFIYHPHCWSMELNWTHTEDDDKVLLLFSLDGIGKVFEWGTEEF